jgi:hypothetical protein
MKFAPNRYVFPGGVFEQEHDASIKWLDVFLKHAPERKNDVKQYFSNLLLSGPQIKRPNLFKQPYDQASCLPHEISYRKLMCSKKSRCVRV